MSKHTKISYEMKRPIPAAYLSKNVQKSPESRSVQAEKRFQFSWKTKAAAAMSPIDCLQLGI